MHSKSKVGGNDFAPWKLPSAAHSYQLHQRLQRATPIDIISDDKGVIYSGGTRIAADSVQNCFSLKIRAAWGDALLYSLDFLHD